MHSKTTSAVAALLALLAALFAAPSSAAERNDDMGETRAGRYFLRVTCEHNEATLRFQRNAIDPYNALSTYAQARRQLPKFKREAGVLSTATYRWARALMNPPAAWPSSVENPVNTAASRAIRVQNALRSAASATSVRGWYDHVIRAGRIWRSVPNATIRARLDLPAPGKGC